MKKKGRVLFEFFDSRNIPTFCRMLEYYFMPKVRKLINLKYLAISENYKLKVIYKIEKDERRAKYDI